jgi:integrase
MRRRTGYLIRRGKVFHAVWTVAGKKFMRTTGKRDRREAETELRRIMEPFVAGDEITTLQNIAARIEGRSAELVRLDDERNPPLPLAGAWTAYMTAPSRPDSGPSTLPHYEGYFAVFVEWLKATHSEVKALRDVTRALAGEYAQHLSRERGLSANSFNKHVRFLELLFRVLSEPARLTVNPWEAVQRKRGVSESRRELTTDELKTVCSAASGEMRLLFAVGIYTGLRLGDAATLRWAEVDIPRRIIRRIPNKVARRNPRPVLIPIHASLAAMLAEARSAGMTEEVLPETAALYRRSTAALSNVIQKHFIRCGVRTIKKDTGTGTNRRAIVEVGFHSLRHTFVSLCRESNAPLAVVEAIVGHSNPAMTRHYTHVSELAAAHAVNGLPALMGDTSPPALPAADPLADIKARILALAGQIGSKNWRSIKAELLQLAEEPQ